MARAHNYWFKQTQNDLRFITKSFRGMTITRDHEIAMYLAMLQYRKHRLILKFRGRRHNPSYKPNTKAYNARKASQGFGITQLVRTGRARDTIVGNATITRGKVPQLRTKAPFYMGRKPGAQIAEGRDWLSLNSRDRRFVMRQYKKYLARARKRTRAKNK